MLENSICHTNSGGVGVIWVWFFRLVGSLFVKDRNKDASLPRRSQVCALTLTRGNFYYTLSGIEPSLDFFRELIVTGSKENFNVHATYRSTNLQRRNFQALPPIFGVYNFVRKTHNARNNASGRCGS